MNDVYLGNIMRLRLDMLINRRRLRVVTAAAMLTACPGTQASEECPLVSVPQQYMQ
jgi:hypothetical protein